MINAYNETKTNQKICATCGKKYENGYRVEWELTRPSILFYCSLNCASRHWKISEEGLAELEGEK